MNAKLSQRFYHSLLEQIKGAQRLLSSADECQQSLEGLYGRFRKMSGSHLDK